VIATAWPEDEGYVRDLGAAETIHYTRDDVISEIRERYPDGIEGLVDLVNFADGFAQLAELVAPGGRAASLLGVADEEQLAARDITATNVVGMADPALLTHLAELVASGSSGSRISACSPWRRPRKASTLSKRSIHAASSPSR
jgi:NADPH2:quinone reductase